MARIARAALAVTVGIAALVGSTTTAYADGDRTATSAEAATKAAREAADAARSRSAEDAAKAAAEAAVEAATRMNANRTEATERAKLPETVVQLQVVGTGKCLEINNGETTNGLQAQQWTCYSNVPAQQWRLVPTPGSSYELRTVTGDKCLEVENSGTQAGAKVQQWGCAGTKNMRWQVVLVDPVKKHFQIRPTHTEDRCLDISGAKPDNAVKAQSWYCNMSDAQLWKILPVK